MKKIHDFYTHAIGKRFDIDGYYGAQCWDGVMYYSQWLGKKIYHTGATGYAKDIWNERHKNGILNDYDAVQRPFKDGDIIVWDDCRACPDSHIAIFRKDNGDGTFIALGQNQGGAGGAFNQRAFEYEGVLGGFRPKPDKVEEVKPVEIPNEKGAVHRFYSGKDHMLTMSIMEANKLAKDGWKYEGIAFYSADDGDPVYRLYKRGRHLFTDSEAEKDALKADGWELEGVAFYSAGSVPIYRMYNPNNGAHILTASRKEHDALTKAGWFCEGQPLASEAAE